MTSILDDRPQRSSLLRGLGDHWFVDETNVSWLIPGSRATWLIGRPDERTNSTASRRNSCVYFDGRPSRGWPSQR